MKFKNFDELLSIVRGKSNRVIVPGANNPEALEAIKMGQDDGLVSGGILIGDSVVVKKMAQERGLDLSKYELVNCTDVQEMCNLAVKFIAEGKGDFLVKGLVDTKFYMKAILHKEAGLVPPGSLLTHFVLFETAHYHKLFCVTDAAITISPDASQKAKIVQNAVDVMRMLGVDKPKVSVVCPVEKVNEKIPSTVDAAELSKMSLDGRIKNAVVEGPYDMYITFSRQLADEKGVKEGVVPGEADIVLFPDLNTANAVYKGLAFFAAGMKAATILVGARVPVILPSRADAPAIKLNSIALCSFLKEQKPAAV